MRILTSRGLYCGAQEDDDLSGAERTGILCVGFFTLLWRRRRLTDILIRGLLYPAGKRTGDKRCDEILNIQTMGLKNGWSIPTAKMRLSVDLRRTGFDAGVTRDSTGI